MLRQIFFFKYVSGTIIFLLKLKQIGKWILGYKLE